MASPSIFSDPLVRHAWLINSDEAGLGGIDVAPPPGMSTRAGDEGQLVILLEEDHDAILELDAFRLLRMKFVQRGDGNLLPGLGLLGGERTCEEVPESR